ncbi:MAG: agmatinase family protein [Bacteroidales bacterium]|nr:agmatinase family protein [Bacteroidales bacterium]
MNLKKSAIPYDPNAVGVKTNTIFGLPFSLDDAGLVIIPAPWDVTTSNLAGTSKGPENVFEQSFQIDLFDPLAPEAWKKGIAFDTSTLSLGKKNRELRKTAEAVINFLEEGKDAGDSALMKKKQQRINAACDEMISSLQAKAKAYLDQGRLVLLLGGDHSVSLGLIRALAEKEQFGILQIDAHADLRNAYQGFTHSHASVMYNAVKLSGLTTLVQVGLREVCPEESDRIRNEKNRIIPYYDHELSRRLFHGETWADICSDIAGHLPENVYISFDVDGLEPSCCPGTGTPVPGGLSFNQAVFLLETLVRKGKRIVGADLVETGPTITDGIISSRLLFRLAGMMIASNQTHEQKK